MFELSRELGLGCLQGYFLGAVGDPLCIKFYEAELIMKPLGGWIRRLKIVFAGYGAYALRASEAEQFGIQQTADLETREF